MFRPRIPPTAEEIRRDEALLRTVLIHGVSIKTLSLAMGVTRQTVYRRMSKARTNLRRAAASRRLREEDYE